MTARNQPAVIENHDDTLNNDCSVCSQSLFSVGQRVVVLPNCHHYVHEDCLNRRFRTRPRNQDFGSCPNCNRQMGAGELVQPADFDVSTGGHIPRTAAMAQKLVQKLLWSSIVLNVMHFLDLLHNEFIQAPLFNSRYEYVRDAGIIPALFQTLRSHEDEPIRVKAFDMLSKSLELGNTQEAMRSLLHVAGVGDVLLQSLSSTSHLVAAASMNFFQKVWTYQDDPRNYRRPIHWIRVTEKVIAAMRRHSQETLVQRNGSRFLKAVSTDAMCVRNIVKSGGLPVLYAAQKEPHHVNDADDCLEHLLRLDLQLA